ncbi:MAG: RnfH family protein [Rhodanobacteraceae bacterium]|nr:RnfH family protein [Rhodanobacteraceae bacterium]
MADRIRVEVAYVEPGRQFLQALWLPLGGTVADAIAASDLQQNFPGLDLAAARTGIFSRPATHATLLREGDRVEIYRALIVNPKEVRRQRAVKTART